MSFIVDFFTWLFTEIGKFFQWLINGIIAIIEEISKFILTAWHEIKKWIGQIMSNPLGAFFFIIWIIGIILIAPVIAEALKTSGITGFIEGAILWIQSQGAAIAAFLKLREILLISDILKVVWEEYKKLLEPLHKAIGSLAGDLGYITNTISLFMQNVKGVITSTVSLMGMPAESIDVLWLDESVKALNELDSRFSYFALHPERFFSWVEETILRPYYKLAGETQSAILNQVDKMYTDLENTVDKVYNLKDSWDKLVRDLPDDIEAQIMTWYKPIKDELDNIYSKYVQPIELKHDELSKIVQKYYDDNKKEVERLKSQVQHPIKEIINQIITNTSEAKKEILQLDAMAFHAFTSNLSELAETHDIDFSKIGKALSMAIISSLQPIVLTYEKDIPFTETKVNVPHKGWNVGEY